MVSTARVNSLQMTTALSPDPYAFFLSLGSAVLSQSCLVSVPVSPHVQTQAEITENTSFPSPESPAPASLPMNTNCQAQGSPLLIRIKPHSLLTQRKEKADSHAKRLEKSFLILPKHWREGFQPGQGHLMYSAVEKILKMIKFIRKERKETLSKAMTSTRQLC